VQTIRDKAALSRRRRFRETPDVTEAVRRLIGAIGRRVGEEDPESLGLLIEVEAGVALAFADAVKALREAGFSDADIGRALGTSRQAVNQRWPWPDGNAL
jgi:hypothetical protein